VALDGTYKHPRVLPAEAVSLRRRDTSSRHIYLAAE